MKKITSTILLSLAITGGALTSCDIDRFPNSYMESDQVSDNQEVLFDNMLNGMYAQLKTWSDPMHRLGEYAGDNMMIRGSSTDAFYEFITYSRTPDNYRLQNFWDYGYKAIAQASNIINMAKETDDAEFNSKLGECYYVRGMMYFYLCRAFGRPYYQAPDKNLGVPIVNGTPSEDEIGNLSLPDRSTVKETYQQAINDLRTAEKLITTSFSSPDYASKEAAQAMLSRVYLYMSGTYENPNREYADSAIYYADRVIESPNFHLVSREDYMKSARTMPENYSEAIFVIKRLAADFPGSDYYYGIGGMYSNIGGMGWGEMYASAKYLELLDETKRNDWRNGDAGIVDARAKFIEPQYITDDNGDYTEVLRFITPNATATGYTYVQLPVNANKTQCSEGDKTYPITLSSDRTPEEEYYTINYNGATYTGVIDYQIALNNGYPMFYITKCSREDGLESQLHSPIISRLDEMYLNRAEAYVKKGLLEEARADVNMIRERAINAEAGYDQATFAADAANLVDKERQLEMAYQAERSYDVFRNGGTLTRRYPGPHPIDDVPATDYRVTYYIPQTAINSYPSGSTLTQNPTSDSGVILN
ncbi:MAG TPA: RagB/SusD family nutrient uptake outer membrane protein [Candidatus Phocaeicola gallinarum]|nr:RagB/SusD family nutrient uptake outer membrane protein [Candidatus Phocaeicola gallinarum]